jgi:hypothetical protein
MTKSGSQTRIIGGAPDWSSNDQSFHRGNARTSGRWRGWQLAVAVSLASEGTSRAGNSGSGGVEGGTKRMREMTSSKGFNSPEERERERQRILQKFYSAVPRDADDEIVGWHEIDAPTGPFGVRLQPITRRFYKTLHDPKWDREHPDFSTVEEKAKRVAEYEQLLFLAEAAEGRDDMEALKTISDTARRRIAEIPAVVPFGGFADIDEFIYPDILTAAEIRSRLLADLQARGLEEWFHRARADRESEGTIQ